jgi:hypothetical protein
MTCHGTGFPTPRVIWRRKIGGSFHEVKDSPRFHVTTNGSLTIRNAKAEDETDYSCEIRNSHSYRADLTIKLNVNGKFYSRLFKEVNSYAHNNNDNNNNSDKNIATAMTTIDTNIQQANSFLLMSKLNK